ncbi:hypothetical protein, conserved [Eimeria brunetti]|uniref:Uncharacterized protein n=1 Tax=Eimeria brunetti TaxID=51314 RepID=U6LRZ1_9EIME|nr:hypothetical protein, conserved [Eimeria brunetti]
MMRPRGPVLVFKPNAKRESGRKAQIANIQVHAAAAAAAAAAATAAAAAGEAVAAAAAAAAVLKCLHTRACFFALPPSALARP